MIVYWLIKLMFLPFAKICFKLKVKGLENLPKDEGFILAPNHSSSLDPFLMIAAIPRYVRWLIIYEFYDQPRITWVLKQMRFIRVKKNLPREVFRALKRKEVLGIFPEGRRTWTGNLGPGRPGAATLARRTHVPVVPIGIKGAFYAMPRFRAGWRKHPIEVRIGKPLYFTQPKDKKEAPKSDDYNTITIMLAISKLLN